MASEKTGANNTELNGYEKKERFFLHDCFQFANFAPKKNFSYYQL